MNESVLTPEEIAEYIHEEFTSYSSMSLEDGKKHLAELIQRCINNAVENEREITRDNYREMQERSEP